MKRFVLLFLLFAFLLVACTNSTTPVTVVTASDVPPISIPTDVPIQPTEVVVPTATQEPKQTATKLPEGVLFRDDFEKELQPGWVWENEKKERWTITRRCIDSNYC